MSPLISRRGWIAGLGTVLLVESVGCAPQASLTGVGRAQTRVDPRPRRSHPAPAAPTQDEPSALLAPAAPAPPPMLRLPPRSEGAETGSAFIERIEGKGRAAIDEEVVRAVTAGNVPPFQRTLVPVTVSEDGVVRATLWVTCDYLAIGSDEDFIRMPMTSAAAQRIADLVDASLPTRKLVDLIYAQAAAKLPPSYIDGGPTDGTLVDFTVHQQKLEERRRARGFELGALTAGNKKDIVLSEKMEENPDRVAIYGWHKGEGSPIQPLSCAHSCRYADYSHGVRLIAQQMTIDDTAHRVSDVLVDPDLADLISDEGALTLVTYPTVLPEYTGGSRKKKRARR